MKKILIVSTVSRQFYLFEQGNIEVLKELGYEVHGAANFEDANERLDALDIIRHPFDIQRSPFNLKNIKAYFQLKKIIREEQFDVVHCHSPMGGVIGRLAAKRIGIKNVLYTAHGFHFYKGAPLINWLLYYPIEKALSLFTDVLITINNEDYEAAKKFSAKEVVQVPGIGVDTKKFELSNFDRTKKREELGVSGETTILLSIGELIKRKNHETALRALSEIKNQNYVYLVCGRGELDSYLKALAVELGIDDKVKFLGFRNDINEICLASDIFVFPSFQEGLPVSMMEAMAAGLPVIASEIRGNVDLIADEIGGCLFQPNNAIKLSQLLDIYINDKNKRNLMGHYNKNIILSYDIFHINKKMREVYL